MNLKALKKPELLNLAKELGIEIDKTKRKPVIIEAIEAIGADDEELEECLEGIAEKEEQRRRIEERARNEEADRREKHRIEMQNLERKIQSLREDRVRALMHKFRDGESIKCFLETYEQVCAEVELSREYWSYPLLFLIPSKVSEVLGRLPKEQFEHYESAKRALFERCGVTVCTRERSAAPVEKSRRPEKPEEARRLECDRKVEDESAAAVIGGTLPTHRRHGSIVGKSLAGTVVTVSAGKAQQEFKHVKSDVVGGAVDHGAVPTHRRHGSSVGKRLARTVATVSAGKAQQLQHVKSDVVGGLKSDAIPQGVPWEGEVGSSSPDGIDEELETVLVPRHSNGLPEPHSAVGEDSAHLLLSQVGKGPPKKLLRSGAGKARQRERAESNVGTGRMSSRAACKPANDLARLSHECGADPSTDACEESSVLVTEKKTLASKEAEMAVEAAESQSERDASLCRTSSGEVCKQAPNGFAQVLVDHVATVGHVHEVKGNFYTCGTDTGIVSAECTEAQGMVGKSDGGYAQEFELHCVQGDCVLPRPIELAASAMNEDTRGLEGNHVDCADVRGSSHDKLVVENGAPAICLKKSTKKRARKKKRHKKRANVLTRLKTSLLNGPKQWRAGITVATPVVPVGLSRLSSGHRRRHLHRRKGSGKVCLGGTWSARRRSLSFRSSFHCPSATPRECTVFVRREVAARDDKGEAPAGKSVRLRGKASRCLAFGAPRSTRAFRARPPRVRLKNTCMPQVYSEGNV